MSTGYHSASFREHNFALSLMNIAAMKRLLQLGLLILFLLAPTAVRAQEHQHGPAADTTAAPPADLAKAEAMMQMHEHMMVDATLHQALMADSSLMAHMRSLMNEMMQGEETGRAMHERMEAMAPDERRQAMARMHGHMMQRMQTLAPGERAALMQQMMAVHHQMMENPVVRERMQAHPDLRRMMGQVMEEMDHDGQEGMEGMKHDGMDGMDHDQMEDMDHGRMEDMDHGRMEMKPDRAASMSAAETREAEAASRTADRFSEALAAGNRAAVEALLSLDAVIMEEGRSETRTEYFSHHFGRDAAFLAAVEQAPLSRRTTVAGEAAWVVSTSHLQGTSEGRSINVEGAELLVLRRDAAAPDGWRIAAVHWSSRAID